MQEQNLWEFTKILVRSIESDQVRYKQMVGLPKLFQKSLLTTWARHQVAQAQKQRVQRENQTENVTAQKFE